ncbi:Hypp3205 [Branchiostoma lanceolatum]|uniref:Hypp3205 protein n=1 Tax=Branchiostoma lanceolatum TaxID=7740 RepID=A0A8K0ER47_BRALA|nr:Hypp3205 [Branchiostoma lanceolatum]
MSLWTFQRVLMDERNRMLNKPVSLVAFFVCAVFPTVLSEVCPAYERTTNGQSTWVDSFSCPTVSDPDEDTYCCSTDTLRYCCNDCTQSLSLSCATGSGAVNLSMGAIVGIAVSAVVCVVLLAAIIALCCSFCCEKKLRASQISVQPAAYPQSYHGQEMFPMGPLQPPPYVPAESPPPYMPQETFTQQNTTSFTSAAADPAQRVPPGASAPARQAQPTAPPAQPTAPPPQSVSLRQRQATGPEHELPPYELTQVG